MSRAQQGGAGGPQYSPWDLGVSGLGSGTSSRNLWGENPSVESEEDAAA